MNNFTLVRPEHLNHHGYLFGGALLRWVDEFAWLVASRDFPGSRLVTIALDHVVFRHPVRCGSILRFSILPARIGKTSVDYQVEVFADEEGAPGECRVFGTRVTFVSVDPTGGKCLLRVPTSLPSLQGEPPETVVKGWGP